MKKFLFMMFSAILFTACAFGFAGCEDASESYPTEHSHEYIETVNKEPTCTEKGKKTYTCKCGYSYTEEIDELGHDFGAWTIVQAPTCTTKGVETRYCSHNNSHTDTREINKLGHEFTDYISDGKLIYIKHK